MTLRASLDKRRPAAHAAGDPGDTISDFQFSPATLTIHIGDTITWTNTGPAAHTATARDGSFDTGKLNKGASASHTFSQAGTFAYYCTIHPFMHGTVVVLANAASSTPSQPSSSGGSNAGSTTPSASSSPPAASQPPTITGPTLPNTGLDTPAAIGVGIGLVGLGLLVRRRLGANQ